MPVVIIVVATVPRTTGLRNGCQFYFIVSSGWVDDLQSKRYLLWARRWFTARVRFQALVSSAKIVHGGFFYFCIGSTGAIHRSRSDFLNLTSLRTRTNGTRLRLTQPRNVPGVQPR